MNGHRLDRNILYVNFAKQKADAKQQRKNDHVNYTQAIYHANYHSGILRVMKSRLFI